MSFSESCNYLIPFLHTLIQKPHQPTHPKTSTRPNVRLHASPPSYRLLALPSMPALIPPSLALTQPRPSSPVTQNTNKPPPPPSTTTSRTEVSSTNATSIIDGTTTPRHLPATAQSLTNGLPAQHQAVGARRDESLRGIGAWTEALSPEAYAAAVVGAANHENLPCDSRSPAQSPQASANRDRERDLLPMERFRRESEREGPFGGKRE